LGKKDIFFFRFGSVLERFSLVKIMSFLLSTYEIWKVLVSLTIFIFIANFHVLGSLHPAFEGIPSHSSKFGGLARSVLWGLSHTGNYYWSLRGAIYHFVASLSAAHFWGCGLRFPFQHCEFGW
jgi:hypothetical protein